VALLFPPEVDRYLRIIKSVFLHGMTLRGGKAVLRPPEQRIAEGGPYIQAVTEKWQQFQVQGADYANKSGAR
jgi:hypothetical protein